MNKILITGKNSYIGTSVENWLKKASQNFEVHTISLRDNSWKSHDLSQYDSIVHVAGIAHSDTGNASEETKQLYYQVNTHLTLELAEKAKAAGVKQFIFLSSMIVYGESASIGTEKTITKDTTPKPANFYGDSKLQADLGLEKLNDKDFHVAIVRPPMIYGKGSKGNYPKLAKLAKVAPIFPDIQNVRSMLHIDNLCEFIKLLIEEQDSGVFHPQNKEYVTTSEMVQEIGKAYNKNIVLTKVFNPVLKLASRKVEILNKVFGNSAYAQELSEYKKDYRIRDFKETIKLTEG